MRIANASSVEELALWSTGWCVSAFLPSHQVLSNDGSDSLRLKNLMRAAEIELIELGIRRADAEAVLADAVPGELGDPTSEVYHRGGVAVFAAPGFSRAYRLVLGAGELLSVGSRFHLKPLLRELAHDHRFYVLAITRGHTRLFAGGREDLRPLDVPGMPASLEDAIQYDDRERALLSHSASRRSVGGVVAAFHGQGDRADHFPEDLSRYLRMVDSAVTSRVEAGSTLVVAGSRDLVALYRGLSGHDALAAENVFGNPETMLPSVLHNRAWQIVDADTATIDGDRAEFERLHGTGLASSSRATVAEAAERGRVKSLFVASDGECWGRAGNENAETVLHESRMPGDEDLLDRSAVDAWLTGATVHVVSRADMPAESTIAAVFRY